MVEAAFRTSWGRAIAAAFRVTGDLDLAEEAAAATFEDAVEQWPRRGVPRSVEAWLVTAARRRAVDQLRRIGTARAKLSVLAGPLDGGAEHPADPEADELRFLALCAGEGQPPEAQLLLVLRFGCGLSTEALAAMFHLSRPTMAARLTRAKQRLKDELRHGSLSGDPAFDADVVGLLPVVHRAIYLVLTAGVNPATGEDRVDTGRLLYADFLSVTLERRWPSEDGTALRILIMLAQDRSVETARIAGSLGATLRRATSLTVQARIAIEHRREPVDWLRVAQHYDALLVLDPNPTFAVGRAVALGHAYEPEVALADLDELAEHADLAGYRYLHAARGDVLARLGRHAASAAAYARAAELASNRSQQAHFRRRGGSVESGP